MAVNDEDLFRWAKEYAESNIPHSALVSNHELVAVMMTTFVRAFALGVLLGRQVKP